MAIDLIKRAAERLAQGGKQSLVERAVGAAASEHAALMPAPEAPVGISAPAEPIAPVQRSSRQVKIDVGHMRLAGMITPGDQNTRIAEEFRIIKRPLLLRAFNGESRMVVGNNHLIMVTSARPSEGKTFVSLNLAMSLASERNLNVLLIDADFKHPSLPENLGIKTDKGLAEVLTEDGLDLSDVILRTDVPNFSFIPAGRPQALATEHLASKRMANLVADIARRYNDRVIVFDAPPVLASTEPSVLALHVGQIVFVVEAEETARRAVEEALTHLKACPNIGLVLNKRRSWLGQLQFGTYYGYPETEE
ncbi:MAG TPA: XrtA-associated tyrosine autokinase [Candidatus Cybelea sp.]|nr:XrtA-associated tyrosine autokinase [Candidatus Cybelea sp.]